MVLFNVSNSATLPPVGQLFTRQGHHGRSAAWQTALVVLVAETVMVATAFVTVRGAAKRGRKPLFFFAFAMLAVRIATASTPPSGRLSAMAVPGGVLYAWRMPETKPRYAADSP